MSNKPNHSVDLIVVQKTSIAKQIVEFPHIDFIFGNQRWIFKDQDLLVHMQQLKHLMVWSHIRAKCNHQKKQRLPSTWRKKSSQASKLQEEYDDQEHQKFIHLVFDPGGHLRNSRSGSLKGGENWCRPDPLIHGLTKYNGAWAHWSLVKEDFQIFLADFHPSLYFLFFL